MNWTRSCPPRIAATWGRKREPQPSCVKTSSPIATVNGRFRVPAAYSAD